ncbi:unnamed protein product, partial [Polarella glacialis]
LVVGVSRACRCITFLCRPHVALRAGGQATKPEAGARMKPFELAISNNNIKYDTNNNNIDNNNNNYSAASLSAALLGFLAAERSVGATPMSPSDINFTDPRNIVSGLFSVVLLGAFVKNNFVDYNGPLASLLGMETGTCRVSHILVDTEEEAHCIPAGCWQFGVFCCCLWLVVCCLVCWWLGKKRHSAFLRSSLAAMLPSLRSLRWKSLQAQQNFILRVSQAEMAALSTPRA